MNPWVRLIVLSALIAGNAAQAQRVDIPTSLRTNFYNPVRIQPGDLVVGDIAASDFEAGPEWNADSMVFSGNAGDVISFQVRSPVPTLLVRIQYSKSHTGKNLFESAAKDAPAQFTLPKTGDYFLVVHSTGAQRVGQYRLAFGRPGALPALIDEAASKAARDYFARWTRGPNGTPGIWVSAAEDQANLWTYTQVDVRTWAKHMRGLRQDGSALPPSDTRAVIDDDGTVLRTSADAPSVRQRIVADGPDRFRLETLADDSDTVRSSQLVQFDSQGVQILSANGKAESYGWMSASEAMAKEKRVAAMRSRPAAPAPATQPALAQTPPEASPASSPKPAAKPAQKPLGKDPMHFMVYIGLREPINGVNANCFSEILVVPAPVDYRGNWPTLRNALPIIESYFPALKAECAKHGTPYGSVIYITDDVSPAQKIENMESTIREWRGYGFPQVRLSAGN
jgi:hypothetical protein